MRDELFVGGLILASVLGPLLIMELIEFIARRR